MRYLGPVTRPPMLARGIAPRTSEYLGDLRVLILNGPRQAGKTTLLRQLIAAHGGELRTLDDESALQAALADPAGFALSDARPLCLDEVQRGGDPLVRAVKAIVDTDDARGQFVLAGSTQFLADPTLNESLAGRAGVLDVLPFSESELAGTSGGLLDLLFDGGVERLRRLAPLPLTREHYLATMVRGGFPEVVSMSSARARASWFTGYVQGVTDRDIRAMARVNEPAAAGAVLRGLAALSGQQLVTNTLAEKADLSRPAVQRYTELLDAVFLVHRLRPWSRNPLVTAVRRPKAYVVDTGLLCHLLGVGEVALAKPTSPHVGPVTETFVVNELRKQISWGETDVSLFHYRDSRGHSEVDIIAESAAGEVVGIEVKAALTVNQADFRHLAGLQAKLGADFVHGIVVYLGREVRSFGEHFTAVPLGALWADLADKL